MKTPSKPASRSTRGGNGKAAPLAAHADSMPEHVPDIAGLDGDGARALPREARIRERAFDLYLARGSEPGHELEDWVAAESQIGEADGHGSAPSEVDTAGDASDVGEEDPGAAEGDLQVSRSLRAEAAGSAAYKPPRARR